MRMMRILVVLALAGTLFPRGAQAQRIDSPYRFVETSQAAGGFVGYIGTGQNAREMGPDGGVYLGARYGIRISGPFGIEGTIGYLPTTRDVFAVDTLAADSTDRALLGTADVQLLLAGVQLRFDLTGPRTWHRLQPFLLAGGGIAVDLASESSHDEELEVDERFDFGTSFAGELGAGIELHLADNLSLRGDVRSHFWKLPTPAAFALVRPEAGLPEDEWISNWTLSAGISLRF